MYPRPLALLLSSAFLMLSYPRLLLLEQNREACARVSDNSHSSSTFVVDSLSSPRTPANPRLSNVDACGVVNLEPLALLRLDLARLRKGLAVDLAESHAALGNGQVASLLEVVPDLGRKLLLGPLHLQDCLVDGLAGDLAGEHGELLDAGGHELALVQKLPLVHPDSLVLGQPAVVLHHLDHLLALPADTAPRVGIHDQGHVLLRLLLDLGASRGGLGTALGGSLNLVLEDVVFDAAVHALLEELLTALGVIELRGHGVGGGGRGGVLVLGLTPSLEDVGGPFMSSLHRRSDAD